MDCPIQFSISILPLGPLGSLRTQTYFRRSLGFADFCDVAILSQSQFSSSSPRTTARGIRASCERTSSAMADNLDAAFSLVCDDFGF